LPGPLVTFFCSQITYSFAPSCQGLPVMRDVHVDSVVAEVEVASLDSLSTSNRRLAAARPFGDLPLPQPATKAEPRWSPRCASAGVEDGSLTESFARLFGASSYGGSPTLYPQTQAWLSCLDDEDYTTDAPASDRLADLSSDRSEDGEEITTRSQRRSGTSSLDSSPFDRQVHPRCTDSRAASAYPPDNDDGEVCRWRMLGLGDPIDPIYSDQEAAHSLLVKLDEKEGRRRGEELLAMLQPPSSDHASSAAISDLEICASALGSSDSSLAASGLANRGVVVLPPAPTSAASPPPFASSSSMTETRAAQSQQTTRLRPPTASPSWSPGSCFGNGAAASGAPVGAKEAWGQSQRAQRYSQQTECKTWGTQICGSQSLGPQSQRRSYFQAEEDTGGFSQQLAHASAICEAARQAFGADSFEVTQGSDGGFSLRLRGAADSTYEDEPQMALELLNRALWPLLGREVLALERTYQQSDADSSKESIVRLTMRCLCENSIPESACWDYVKSRGGCPRGSNCRWPHVPPKTRAVDIEVLFGQ